MAADEDSLLRSDSTGSGCSGVAGSPHANNNNNVSASRIPLMLRLRGTVILKTWWQILLVVLYTSIIVSAHLYVDWVTLNFPQTLISILGAVTGLLLAFRTNTAYDRYWEGRRLWSTLILNIRTLTRCIWVGIKDHNSSRTIVEKKSALNLLIAFAIATKHYLREEYSYDWPDLREYLAPITSLHAAAPSSGTSSVQQTHRKRDHFTARDIVPPTNIPIEITYYLASYISSCRDGDKCDGGTIGQMNGALTNLVDCLTSFERILRTPIPVAYSVHLHHMTWVYILTLPFQLVGLLGWWTVAIVGVATFSFLGILEIGWEIENPFGYDANDLPLDDFCNSIREEITRITSRDPVRADEWIFTPQNRPYAPESGSQLTAAQLSQVKPGDLKLISNKKYKL